MTSHKVDARPEETSVAENLDTRNWVAPLVDITEGFDELRVVASVPGALHEDIDVTFEKGVLRIKAQVRSSEEKRSYLLREFEPGGYDRSFRIHESIDASKIEAEYTNGVLTLHLPKQDAARSRSIPVLMK